MGKLNTFIKGIIIFSTLTLLGCGGSGGSSVDPTPAAFATITMTGVDTTTFGTTLAIRSQQRTTSNGVITVELADRNYTGNETPAEIINGFNAKFETATADTDTILVINIVLNGNEHEYVCDSTNVQAPLCDATTLNYDATTGTLTIVNALITNPVSGTSLRVSVTITGL